MKITTSRTPIQEVVTTVGLAALAINQLLGPSATRFALVKAGEDHKDRPRLLDFLQEQRIMVNLTGNTRKEVIHNLSELLFATSPMPVSRDTAELSAAWPGSGQKTTRRSAQRSARIIPAPSSDVPRT